MEVNLRDGIKLLKEYAWIYDFQLTHFFVDKVLSALPESWGEYFNKLTVQELNLLPFGNVNESCPEDLRVLLAKVSSITPSRDKSPDIVPVSVTPDLQRGMNPKKHHEVSNMTSVVHQIALQTGCDVIVDVGSGLGYLGQVLNRCYGYKVIGLESKQGHTSGAEKRTCKEDSMKGIKNVTFELEDSHQSMEKFRHLVSQCCREFEEQHQCTESSSESVKLKSDDSKDFSKPMDTSVSDEERIQTTTAVGKCRTCSLKSEDSNNCSKEPPCMICMNISKQTVPSSHTFSERRSEVCGRRHDQKVSDDVQTVSQFTDGESDSTKDLNQRGVSVLMIGLHCCGDLTPTMMKYFSEMNFVKGLCCVSCCFHRMKTAERDSARFENFPLSDTVKRVCKGENWLPSLYALRLAAQETRARWKNQTSSEHEYHVKNVAYRGILQLYLQKEKAEYSKIFRKIARKSDYTSFDTYIDAACSRLSLENRPDHIKEIKECLKKMYKEYEHFFKFIEPITALQVTLQPLLEWVIYKDREIWLTEQKIDTEIKPVFDDFVSPRNLALIANKSKQTLS